MNTLIRNILAVILGFVLGSIANIALVVAGPRVIPPPPGVDFSNAQNFAANLHLLEPRHFIFPFLAHAIGTLVGALVAYLIAGSRRVTFAYVLGVLFLAGGIVAVCMYPAPVWFDALDLVVAYLPMAWLAVKLGRKFRSEPTPGAT